MPRTRFGWLGAVAVLLAASVGRAQLVDDTINQMKAGGPVVGADVGAAIPISKLQTTADPGGSIAPFIGWQIGNGKGFTVTPLVEVQFAGFTGGGSFNDGAPSITSTSGGARFSLNDENAEIYLGVVGGYFWSTGGPSDENGGGFGLGTGLNYEFWRGGAVGIFARYNQANIEPYPGADSNQSKFLTTGLEVRQRFLAADVPPPPPPVVAAAPPPPVKKKIVLRGVNFDFDKANIRPDAVPILDEAARTLKEAGDVTVAVNGYTDGIGSIEYNDKLSLRRATAVRDYLEKQGVAASRMSVHGFGKSNPVATNETADGRAQNRRVELIVNNP